MSSSVFAPKRLQDQVILFTGAAGGLLLSPAAQAVTCAAVVMDFGTAAGD